MCVKLPLLICSLHITFKKQEISNLNGEKLRWRAKFLFIKPNSEASQSIWVFKFTTIVLFKRVHLITRCCSSKIFFSSAIFYTASPDIQNSSFFVFVYQNGQIHTGYPTEIPTVFNRVLVMRLSSIVLCI